MKRFGIARLFLCGTIGVLGSGARIVDVQAAPPRPPALKAAPPTPIAETSQQLGKPGWDPDWDSVIEKALPREMLTDEVVKAVKPFCPRFHSIDEANKRAFWAYFFQALAGAEAALVPTTNVRHLEPEVAVQDTVTLRMVRSEGLLQLTYMDANRYGCDFDWGKDKNLTEQDPEKSILRPENNLRCGVKILSNQLLKRHKPLLTRSSYWSTLHPHGLSHKVFLQQMSNVPQICREAPSIATMAKNQTPKPVVGAVASAEN